MKQKLWSLIFFCNAFICFTQVNKFSVQEIYVGYYFADNYAHVIEYNIVHKQNTGAIAEDVESIKKLIGEARYVKEKYNYTYFTAVEESASNEGKFIKGDFHLVTAQSPSFEIIEDLFSKTLGKKVSVKAEDGALNVYFDGSGIKIGSNNAAGVYKKENLIKISFPQRLSKIEIVFQKSIEHTEPILQFITGKIASPEKSAEEIDYLKNASPALDKTEQAFQDDCDIIRLQDLVYYGKLIEEYKTKTGTYPFEGNTDAVCCLIYNKEQKKYSKDDNPNKHILISPKEFYVELEKGLGRKIEQRFDPQYAPSGRPVFYIYMIDDGEWFFAVHLSKYYRFSKKVDSNYYKAELSNVSDKNYKLYTVSEMERNEEYIRAVSRLITKKGFFEVRKNKHIGEY